MKFYVYTKRHSNNRSIFNLMALSTVAWIGIAIGVLVLILLIGIANFIGLFNVTIKYFNIIIIVIVILAAIMSVPLIISDITTKDKIGKTIGISISHSGKRGKGDLFKLRKARKPDDFLNEINRIQMKYDALITADLYNKGQDFIDNFTEFKHFCMIAALNTFNAGNRQNQTTETTTN